MKTLYILSLIVLIITVSSCLTYRVAEYTIEFAEDFNSGTITVRYTDIRSAEEEDKKQKEDFEELIRMYQKDMFLLDQVDEGVYVKDRQLYEQDGSLHANYSGIFQKLKIDESEFKVHRKERFILLDASDEEKIVSNGKVFQSDYKVLLVWPNHQRVLTFKRILKDYDDKTYPLIDYYTNWKE